MDLYSFLGPSFSFDLRRHELNFETNTWTLICADTSKDSRLSGSANHRHSIHAHPGAGALNEHAGEMPSARCSHGAVVLPSGDGSGPIMYVFGGYPLCPLPLISLSNVLYTFSPLSLSRAPPPPLPLLACPSPSPLLLLHIYFHSSISLTHEICHRGG